MACTVAFAAPVVARPATSLKQASKNTFAARTVSNGSIQKTTAMQGKISGALRGQAASCSPASPLFTGADPYLCALPRRSAVWTPINNK